jgi:hypothetical protein
MFPHAEALNSHKLTMVSIDIATKTELGNKEAFICNSLAHWIAIRRIHNVWYNLNSLGMRLP